MTPRLERLADASPRPWRNGGGVTRELLAWPRADGWRVRVSVADVDADGPFSAFPGVRRWFAVLDGAGVELDVDGRRRRQRRDDAPLDFDGAATVHCRLLDGPTRDLNLMLAGVPGAMQTAVDGAAWTPPPGAVCGLYAGVAGRCADVAVPAQCVLWFDRPPPLLSFRAGADGAPGTAVGHWLWALPDGEPQS